MPREFGISSYMTLLFGRGHQSPEWESWSAVIREGPIKVLRLVDDIETHEKKAKVWIAPGQAIAFAKKEGLTVTQDEIKELIELHKERFERKGVPPWAPGPPEIYTLNISIAPPGKGSVTPPGGDFDAGDTVIVTASPQPGYVFNGWTGDYVGGDNPTSITMDSNKTIVAHFKKE